MSQLHVVIVGGGIGGLCLAQGLKRFGVSCAVYERDPAPFARSQGYRIHVDPQGSVALRDCLSEPLFKAFERACTTETGTFRFVNHRLEELLVVGGPNGKPPADPVAIHRGISRVTLRKLLLEGLEGVVHFGKTFASFEEDASSRPRVLFEDGDSAAGDLVAGADGASSRLRAQFLPDAKRIDTGIVGIGAKVPLSDQVREAAPWMYLAGPAIVLAPEGRGMFGAPVLFRRSELGEETSIAEPAEPDYLLWALSAREGDYPAGLPLEARDGRQLIEITLEMTRAWDPRFAAMIRETDPTSVGVQRIRTSLPVPPWPTRNITLLGDAIHSMTPYRGIGGNVALRDAANLCRALAAANDGKTPLLEAISSYERSMREYGFAAVRDSFQAMQMVHAQGLSRTVSSLLLRTINAVPMLKSGMLARR